jgi:MOSC domain-containing protein YiiM
MIVADDVLTGYVGPSTTPSGIDKRSEKGRVFAGREGFAGDAEGDCKHHNRPERPCIIMPSSTIRIGAT